MKNGRYKVVIEIEVDLTGMQNTDEATKAIAQMIVDLADDETPIEGTSFALLEEFEEEYETEEDDGLEELDFDQAG